MLLVGIVHEIVELAHWIAEQVGLTFWHDETGNISHNLRTVVVDASGRMRKIFSGNQWSSSELLQEMLNAADTAH